MHMKIFSKHAILTAVVIMCMALSAGLTFGQLSTGYYYPDKIKHDWQGLIQFTNATGPSFTGTITPAGVTASGTIQALTLTATGAANVGTILTRKGEVLTNSAVALATPVVTFSAANKGLITLTSTGTYTPTITSITGGALNQIITIVPGAGADAMTFANCTSITLPATVVMTEGSTTGEALSLRCTSADGDDWTLYALPGTTVSGTTGSYSGVVTAAGLETIDTITAGTAVANKAAILGATYNLDQLSVAALTHTGALTRTAQTYTFTDAKLGSTGSGWVVNAAADLWSSTCPASQTSETLIIPVSGLHVGDIITGGNLVGQVESAGGSVQINIELRKLTAAAADLTDATVSDIVRATAITADAILSVSNTTLGTMNETVGADETFYFLVTATTAGSTDIALQGAQLKVTQK
jgi:hypothetical protein